MLVDVLLVRADVAGWTHRPLWLAGARITGSLDLAAARLIRPLQLEDCSIEQLVNLTDVEAMTIGLTGCHVPRIEASGLTVRGDLVLSAGFTATDGVDLHGGTVGGKLNCDGGNFSKPQGISLNCGSVVVKESMWTEKATFVGEMYLLDAHINGQLVCNGATFTNWGGDALTADGLVVEGAMFCAKGFAARGAVRLPIAHIGGGLYCSGGTFTNPQGRAIYAADLTVDGPMSCRDGFEAVGAVVLTGAHIGGGLKLHKAKLKNPGGTALDAAGLVVEGSMFCRDGFEAVGTVELTGARIGGNLNFCASTLVNSGSVGPNPQARSDGSAPPGALQLVGATIGGDLNCTGATLSDIQHGALNARRVVIRGDMICAGAFAATGEVNLVHARVSGDLDCSGASFTNACGTALDLVQAEIGKDVVMRPTQLVGDLDLRFARTGGWYDSATTWPSAKALHLHGFTYRAIDAIPQIDVKDRLDWIARDAEGFMPQPYAQLATVYRGEGNEGKARQVQIRGQWRRRLARSDKSNGSGRRWVSSLWSDWVVRPLRVVWSALLWITVGYGYRPWLILGPIGALYFFGWWWFDRAFGDRKLVQVKDLDTGVTFSGARYTADLLIPGASLGERARFAALPEIAWWTTGYTLAGWALAAMLIAGLTGVFRRL
ncbi:hypothetical protein [Kribbella sindirgiensis]|uniref:Oxidoreductase n=1 Tax=Kribbella sindirgiensis TaxID=1124744 RepID=A0A4R0I3R3_9ACTN|nr:hypothetical protein [Kribbella sindirgiensis]TCC21661.1 hypothetical protein E0H50_35900 [Kribbella sindirgiensis]